MILYFKSGVCGDGLYTVLGWVMLCYVMLRCVALRCGVVCHIMINKIKTFFGLFRNKLYCAVKQAFTN